MQSASDAFASFIEAFEFQKPKCAVYTNVTGEAISDPEAIKEALVQQIVSSVRFENCLINAKSAVGYESFIECGPARVLAGLLEEPTN